MEAWVTPHEGVYHTLDFTRLIQILKEEQIQEIALPFPDGQLRTVRVDWVAAAEAGYYDRHPQTGTYRIWDPRDPTLHGRIDHTVKGYHAMFQWQGRTVMTDPVFRGRTDVYTTYFRDAYHADPAAIPALTCDVAEELPGDLSELIAAIPRSNEVALRTYRLAIACTGEYSQYHGGTKELVSAELITAVNRLNSVMEVDMGVRLLLVRGQ